MKEDLAAVNVTRSYTLAGTNIAISTFMLSFLYPRFESGRINPVLFQATLIAMGVATFSLVFATLHYYRSSLGGSMSDTEGTIHARRADRFWLLGYTTMFLAPSLVLFLVRLSYRRICLARLLALVPVLHGPLLPEGSDAEGVQIE